MTSTLDLSLPLSALLWTETMVPHQTANRYAGSLARGELDKEVYICYLMMLWHVYDNLERELEKHASHPILEPVYNPALLARAPSLASDISYLLQVPESSWQSHPLHVELMSTCSALGDYTKRLRDISESADPSGLLAHAYVRYLGDLSGGQIVGRNIGKAYGLDEEGLAFYKFKELGGNNAATSKDLKTIKDWYKAGMNAATGDNKQLKFDLIEEAKTAFDLNIGILATLPGTSQHSAPAITPPATFTQQQPSIVTIGGVVSAVHDAAVGLADLVFVVGGSTGKSGYDKLLGAENWFRTLFQSSA